MTSEDGIADTEGVGERVDEGVVDLLSWLLETETKARLYVALRRNAHATSREVADCTGLYPSTVREALAELHEDGTVTRRKRKTSDVGNNPYEYEAISPAALVEGTVEQVQTELNTVFNLDRHLGTGAGDETNPVAVSVRTGETDDCSTERTLEETELASSHETPGGTNESTTDGGIADGGEET